MSRLKIIALISGGKDSLFSILHLLANGHEVVALANLYPQERPHDGGDDIDSYMYQTVGHSVIPLYEQALDIPLYRRPIKGSAVNTNTIYTPAPEYSPSETNPESLTEEDETESLIPLLRRVLVAHPDANALSTGAILSTYQRTRVESVALRLGLTSLSYLWQYPSLPPYTQTSLLLDMRAAGQKSRIIKVASGGLDEGFLWDDVSDARVVKKLQTRMARFGAGNGAVLGEGGEFETVALDGPSPLWKGKIEVEVEEVIHGEGGSAVVKLAEGRVVEKTDASGTDSMETLRIPALLDDEFERLQQLLKQGGMITTDRLSKLCENGLPHSTLARSNAQKPSASSGPQLVRSLPAEGFWSCTRVGNTLYISNMISMTAPLGRREPKTQMAEVVHRLRSLLQDTYHVPTSSVVFSTLLLRSMKDFTVINPVYGSMFTEPSPPARVTVACGDTLPDEVEVMLSVVLDLGPAQARKGLHVQSRSYWAPANIGPYSQAIAVPVISGEITDYYSSQHDVDMLELVHVAGQIPLVPASMELVQDDGASDFRLQTVLALQHLWRIGRAMNVVWWTAGMAFISQCRAEEVKGRVRAALKAWESIHQRLHEEQKEHMETEDEDIVDVWDMKYGVSARAGTATGPTTDGRPLLPDYSKVLAPSHASIVNSVTTPPCFVVQVDELPRGADVEWTSIGLAANRVALQVTKQNCIGAGGANTSFRWISIAKPTDVNTINKNEDTEEHYTVYTAQSLPLQWLECMKPRIIPCRRIWGDDGEELAAVIAIARFQQNPPS